MSAVLNRLPCTQAYIDDIVVHLTLWEQHLRDLASKASFCTSISILSLTSPKSQKYATNPSTTSGSSLHEPHEHPLKVDPVACIKIVFDELDYANLSHVYEEIQKQGSTRPTT